MLVEAGPPPVVVRGLDQLKLPPVPSLILEREGVSQTHLVIKLLGIKPSWDPGGGKGVFQLEQINFCDWQGHRLREEVLQGNQVSFGLNHDNFVFVYREDRRYKPSLSEEIRDELLVVVALLGSGTNVPEQAEIWPLLPEGEGSYISGDLIVLSGPDAELVMSVYQEMVGEGWEETEDTWKEAIKKVAEEKFK